MRNWIVEYGSTELTESGEWELERLWSEVDKASRKAVITLCYEQLPIALRVTTEISKIFPRVTFAIGDEFCVKFPDEDYSDIIENAVELVCNGANAYIFNEYIDDKLCERID